MTAAFSRNAVDGAALIASERARQVSAEGWTPAHDDDHWQGELVKAAVAYALPGMPWPWEQSWYKPSGDRIRDLTKAGALIAAEIDRLARRPTETTRSSGGDSA